MTRHHRQPAWSLHTQQLVLGAPISNRGSAMNIAEAEHLAATRIRVARKELGLSLQELADRLTALGVETSNSTLSRIETRDVPLSLARYIGLSRIFGADILRPDELSLSMPGAMADQTLRELHAVLTGYLATTKTEVSS